MGIADLSQFIIMSAVNGTLLEIVSSNYRSAGIFSRYGIDLNANGNNTLEEICSSKGIDSQHISQELTGTEKMITVSSRIPISSWKLSFLADYIENIHHAYTEIILPELEQALTDFNKQNGGIENRATMVLSQLQALKAQVILNNQQESEILFPYIRQLESLYLQKNI